MSRSSKVTTAGNPIKFWKTKDGRTTAITQMETRHIEHCIRLIEADMGDMGLAPWRHEYLPRLKLELAYRRARKQ